MAENNTNRTSLNPQLRLIRFIWDKRDSLEVLDFAPGFNLISDYSQTERTIILRLIRYAMGGSHNRIGDEIRQETKEVKLQFLAKGKLITTTRGFQHPDGKFSVVEDDSQKSLSPKEMGEFLLDLLDIPKVYYQRGQSKVLLSFNDLARSFVVDRDFSYTEMLSQVYPEQKKEVVKLMLGLTTQEIADLQEKIRGVEIDMQRLDSEMQGIESMLSEFNVGTLTEIDERRASLQETLEQIQKEENDLRKAIRTAASQKSQGEEYESEEYQTLSREFVEKRERLRDIDGEIAVLAKQVEEKSNLKALLESEVRKLERHTTSHYVLSSFTFSRCPRCLSPIDTGMRERENEGKCMLCARDIRAETEFETPAWNKSLADAKKSVQESDQLLAYYSNRSKILELEGQEIRQRIEWIQAELIHQTAEYVSPLVEDMSLINERRTNVRSELSQLKQEEKQRRYVDRMRTQVLPKMRQERNRLQEKLEELQMIRGRHNQRQEAFLSHFDSFMRQTASPHYSRCSWDEDENDACLPKINGEEHIKALIGPDLAISVLAFHYALLATKIKPPRFDTAHPGLLIVDEPEQQKMETSQYRRIMQLLVALSSEYSEEVQIIVAATDSEGFEDYLQPIIITKK